MTAFMARREFIMLLSGAALRRREVIAGLPARGVANRNVRRFKSLFKGRHRLLPFLQEPPGAAS